MTVTMQSVGSYEASLMATYAGARRRLRNDPPPPPIVTTRPVEPVLDLAMASSVVRPILLDICSDFKVKPESLMLVGKGRPNRARDELLAQVREETGWSLKRIGWVFRISDKATGEAIRRARPSAPATWTKEVVAELTRLHGLGVSSSVIATVLGTSRNAIIGKVRRLRLSNGRLASSEGFPPLSPQPTDGA